MKFNSANIFGIGHVLQKLRPIRFQKVGLSLIVFAIFRPTNTYRLETSTVYLYYWIML